MSVIDPVTQTGADPAGTVTAADILAAQQPDKPETLTAPQPEIPPAQPAPAAQPAFRVELPTGQVYTGNTQEEVLQQLVKAQTSASELINRQKEQIALLNIQRQNGPAQPARATNVGPAQFDQATYWQLQAQDPLKAHDYLMRHYTGVDDPRSAITESYNTALKVEQAQAVNSFKANNPDFPATAEAGQLMAARHATAFPNIPITPDTLEVVYRGLVREGLLRPVANVAPAAPSRGAAAPPSAGGMTAPAVAAAPVDESAYDQLTTQQLEKLLVAKGMKR